MWLVDAAGLRLLFDPLLGPEHHCGVFETVPRRRIDARALRADFLLVSHRHPDHFDVPSLHRLARIDPDTVVVTPDTLVAWAARTLGFATVHLLPPGQRVALDGVTLVSTPSLGADEWGMLVGADGAVAWNQVDAVLRDAAHVREVLDTALPALGATGVDVGIVRWQPMLEIAAVLGRRTAFPYASYADLLQQVAAVGAKAIVPGANGAAHVAAHRWLDRFVFPVSEARFARDLAGLCPDTQRFPLRVGSTIHARDGTVHADPQGAMDLVELESPPQEGASSGARDLRRYRPLAMPDLDDPNPHEHPESITRPRTRAWIHHELADALARAWPSMRIGRTLRCVVEVAFGSTVDRYTLHVGPQGTRVIDDGDDDWDLLNVVAGSYLWEVIEGRRHWGDVLLAGCLRAVTRAYDVDADGLHRARVGETFLYYGLSYDAAVERAVKWEVATVARTVDPSKK